jgi:hypothetical protein
MKLSLNKRQTVWAVAGVAALVLASSVCWAVLNHDRQAEAGSAELAHAHSAKDIHKTPEHLIAKRDALLAMLDPEDRNTIFKVVDAIQADSQFANNCHEVAHDVGHQAFEYYGFSDAMTFDNPEHVHHALVQNICAGGYMHGILEQMSLSDPGFLQEPERVCDRVPESERASCFHGIGHVYMVEHERDVPKAILGCRVIKLNADMYRCFEGVRMEQFWGGYNSTSPVLLGWDPQDPLQTCIAANKDEKPTCFLYSTFGYLRIHPREYANAAQLCATKPGLDDFDRHFCLKGLGMTMMSKFKGAGLEGSEKYSAGLTAKQKLSFYEGMVNYSMLSGKTSQNLRAVCGLLKTDASICLEALNKNI